jgi:putative FmdB family regulatory protein
MPFYEYRCDHCGHEFERRQNMSDPPVKECPECGKSVRRLFSLFAGIVPGSSPRPCDMPTSPCAASGQCSRRSCQMLDG